MRLPLASRGRVPAGVRRLVLCLSCWGSCLLPSCPVMVCRQALLFAFHSFPGLALRLGVLVGPSAKELGWVRFFFPTEDGTQAFAAGQGGEMAGTNVLCLFLCFACRNAHDNDCDGEDCAGSGKYFDMAPSPLNVRDGVNTDCSACGGKECGGDACGGPDAAGMNVQASICNLLAPSLLNIRDGIGKDGSACSGASSGASSSKNCGGNACGSTAASSGWTTRAKTNVQASA